MIVTELGVDVTETGVVVVVTSGVGVVVETGRRGGVELEGVMCVVSHKTKGP